MNDSTLRDEPPTQPQEARMLARELAAAYEQRVLYLKLHEGLSHQEAEAKAAEPRDSFRLVLARTKVPEKLSWDDLAYLNLWDGDNAIARWRDIKQAAREALREGDVAGTALERHGSGPWERAQFLAIREELANGWGARNGMERQLLDAAALALASYLHWLGRLSECDGGPGSQEAADMAERFHRMYLRTLRTLGSLRRVPMAVVVQNAGQVNVGSQQVNVAGGG
jgi:hypothetical protein